MIKYRFLTKQEFKDIGEWNHTSNCPNYWNSCGDMNKYLGTDVPEEHNKECDANKDIYIAQWSFKPHNYKLIEDVVEDYVGKHIKALIHSPNYTGVKLGETIKIIGKKTSGFYELDETSSGCREMGIRCPLNLNEWELVDTSVINTNSLVGRWVKVLKYIGENYPIGSYDIITEDDPLNKSCFILKEYRSCHRGRLSDGDLELMPEGFEPEPIIPEYVKCIIGYGSAKVGIIYSTSCDKSASKLFCLTWKEVLIQYKHLGDRFAASTKQEYDIQHKISFDLYPIGTEVMIKHDSGYISQGMKDGVRIKGIIVSNTNDSSKCTDVDSWYIYRVEFKDKSDSNSYRPTDLELWKESKISWAATTGDSMVGITKIDMINYNVGIDPYDIETAKGYVERSKLKALIEPVHSISVKLRTKKQINKHLKF